jgi:hypothetical protein
MIRMTGKRQGAPITLILLLPVLLLSGRSPVAAAGELAPLRLSFAPLPSASSEDCGHLPAPSSGAGRPQGLPQSVEESEHRPVPMRTYYFNEHRRWADVQAYVRRPDGSVIEPEPHLGVNPTLSFPTPLGNGPVHGANNVYVVEQGVDGNNFVVRTAKWITMHHSCGWGHDGKFDQTLIHPQPLAAIPFEIVVDDLWDPNFHAKVTSGNQLRISVLSFGKPVAGARVTLTTDQGWNKKVVTDLDGMASVQLIRDYYPSSWAVFDRTHRGQFLVTARYDADLQGTYAGKPYERISYVATLPWKYSPSERDYSSYSYGLLIGTLTLTVSGVGVYAYRERRKRPYQGIVFDE